MRSATETKQLYNMAAKEYIDQEKVVNTQEEIETVIAECCSPKKPQVPTCHCEYIAPELNQYEIKYIKDIFTNFGYGVSLNKNTFTIVW